MCIPFHTIVIKQFTTDGFKALTPKFGQKQKKHHTKKICNFSLSDPQTAHFVTAVAFKERLPDCYLFNYFYIDIVSVPYAIVMLD